MPVARFYPMETINPTTQEKQRTNLQNNSLHRYCRRVAILLNDAGIEQHIFLKDIEVPHSMESIKSVWKAIEHANTRKTSTTEMSTKECTEIYDIFNRHLSKFGIHEPWPSLEEIANSQLK